VHYFHYKESSEQALRHEIERDLTKEIRRDKGVPLLAIPASIDLSDTYLGFSTAALVDAKTIGDDTISKQAQQIVEQLCAKIPSGSKINFHCYSITDTEKIIETGRAEILKEKIKSLLKKERILPLRKNFDRSLGFVQVAITPNRSLLVSVINCEELNRYRSLISPFPGGFTYGEEDKDAPSRAFRKICEAQEIMGISIEENEQVIDLGACPGGWSYVARKRGANVIALDRSPLRDDLMNDPQVQFIQADAFKYQPTVAIDWAVSDIICAPERIKELIQFWVAEKRCRRFIFTIKFHGSDEYPMLSEFKAIVQTLEFSVILKQLNANKNEVTIMGWKQE